MVHQKQMKRNIHEALGRYLGIRSRSEGEVRSYLSRKSSFYSLDEEKIESLIAQYKDVGLINDANFVEAVVHSALSKGKGQAFIKQKLMLAKVDKELIAAALREPSQEDLRTAMEKRLRRYERKWEGLEPKLKRQKAYTVLFSSGFPGREIASFIDVWLKSE
jgi:SOS response regulatory protein OraA/RecX